MSAKTRAPRRRWAIGCLIILIAIPLLYYGGQVALRTQPLTTTQVIAHRGGASYAPENTLAAFKNAIAQGADWLEFDVQMTRDGALVVIHDETVDRTTNGTGAVRDLSLEQIKALDAGNGEQIPTFEEVVALAKASGTKILPEAKSAHLYPGIEAKMLKVLTDADYLDQTVIQSFEADSLVKLHALNPDVNLCALYGLWKFNVRQPPADAKYICPMGEMVLLNPDLIRQAHSEGRQAFVWFGILENPFVFRLMRFFGADGLIGNDPLAIKAAVSAP